MIYSLDSPLGNSHNPFSLFILKMTEKDVRQKLLLKADRNKDLQSHKEFMKRQKKRQYEYKTHTRTFYAAFDSNDKFAGVIEADTLADARLKAKKLKGKYRIEGEPIRHTGKCQ